MLSRFLIACWISVWGIPQAWAQDTVDITLERQAIWVVLLDSEALFANTAFGKRIAEELRQQAQSLQDDFTALETELAKEEKDLAQKRSDMELNDFRALAEAFDEKVQSIRRTQRERANRMNARFEAQRTQFFATVTPILQTYMTELGASVMLERKEAILNLPEADITARAIAHVDRLLGDGKELETINE